MFSAESGKRTRAVIGENGVVVGDITKQNSPAIGTSVFSVTAATEPD